MSKQSQSLSAPFRYRRMRELIIQRRLNRSNELENIIVNNPHLSFTTIHTNLSEKRFASVVLFRGDKRSLNNLKEQYINHPPPQIESITTLKEGRNYLVVYEVEKSGINPTDISFIIYSTLGPDTVLKVNKSIDGVTWAILTFHPERVELLMERLKEAGQRLKNTLKRNISWYELNRHTNSEYLGTHAPFLNTNEERAVKMAIQMGYYDTPKKCEVRKIAEQLKTPRSTVHYNLKKAERKILKQFVMNLL